ncbi:MAG TPA: site-specific DNA-methyltransferase, partial [Anaerolineaceae bacterium]|nr:site-specific DNA-methyltransferase [Anaerolineaceae bacterium]
MNTLYYGDNLEVLQRHIRDESVDLIYLDPPFNSNASYNVLFAQKDGKQSSAQIQAFEDTWQWDETAIQTYTREVEKGGPIADALRAFNLILGDSNMMAYLTMMAPRLKELHRVLKPTGSLYLHCDPTASHYLKVLLDMVFGAENFRNEIIWVRSNPKSHGTVNFPNCTDTILRYTKTNKYFFKQPYGQHNPEYVKSAYKYKDEKG